jgi:hypothetical protein
MRKLALLLLLALARPASADYMVDLEANLADFTRAFAATQRAPGPDSDLILATTEKFITDQIFSLIDEERCMYKDEKLYKSAFEGVNRLSRAYPAAVADLGMKLEVRWEAACLVTFYRVQGLGRRRNEGTRDSGPRRKVLHRGQVVLARIARGLDRGRSGHRPFHPERSGAARGPDLARAD